MSRRGMIPRGMILRTMIGAVGGKLMNADGLQASSTVE
jgi:hypothetical protein